MKQARWQQIKRLVELTLEQEPQQRAAFLQENCHGDELLVSEVAALIAFEKQAEEFLEQPAFEAGSRPESSEQWRCQPKGTATMLELVGQSIDNKYQIEKRLGQGGMGAVYLATHLGTGRLVAVKVIAPQLMSNQEFVARFKREAKATGALRHPNVINVTDFGFTNIGTDQLAYLVMEYLDGCSLADLLNNNNRENSSEDGPRKSSGRLSLELIIEIVEQICLAVGAAHKQGIIHRDLKPDNIWLAPNERGGYHVKVLDFGLAKLRDIAAESVGETRSTASISPPLSTAISPESAPPQDAAFTSAVTMIRPLEVTDNGMEVTVNRELPITRVDHLPTTHGNIEPMTIPGWLTRVGTVLGTPTYMSPEQCHGKELDARADIYSLGVIVYQMLTGEPPFSGDLYQLIFKHTEMLPPSLAERRPDLPRAAAAVVLSALAKNAAERPISANAFATALRLNIEGERPTLSYAFDLYRKHLGTFLIISLRAYLPFIAASLLAGFLMIFTAQTGASAPIFRSGYLVLLLPLILLANSANISAIAGAIAQLLRAPHQPIDLKAVFRGQFQQLKTIAIATLLSYRRRCTTGWRRAPLQLFTSDLLCAPVIGVEQSQAAASLARSGELTGSLRPLLMLAETRNILLALGSLLLFPVIFVIFSLPFQQLYQHSLWPQLMTAIMVSWLLIVLIHPIIAITFSLLYFRANQINRESAISITVNEQISPVSVRGARLSFAPIVIYLMLLVTSISLFMIGRDLAFTMTAPTGHTTVLAALLAVGANVDARDRNGNTALMLAAHEGHQETVGLLITAGARLDSRNNQGKTALMQAAQFHHIAAVNRLISAGADLNIRDNEGNTVLIQAANSQGHAEIVKLLLGHHADLNIRAQNQLSALMFASITGSIESVRALLAAGAGNGSDPISIKERLMAATLIGRADIVRNLLDQGADINATLPPYNITTTPLTLASFSGRMEIVKLLLERGADIKSRSGQLALRDATRKGHIEIVKLLLERGAPVDSQDGIGKTPLIYAVEEGQIELVKLLLAAGADLKLADSAGNTPLAYATDNGYIDIVTIINHAAGR